MKKPLQRTVATLRREGPLSVLQKIAGRYNAWRLHNKLDFNVEQKRWAQIKDSYKGEEVFVIGNGPSLNKTPLYLLHKKHTMCFNRFTIMLERLNWAPSFFLTADDLVLSDMIEELEEIVPQTRFSFFPGIHFRGHNYMDATDKFPNAHRTIQKVKRGFSEQLPLIHPGGTVIYEGFQILKHLGFKTVYMVGVDMNYQIHNTAKPVTKGGYDIVSQQDDDPNHFDPRYFGKNRKYHQPEESVIKGIMASMKYLAEEVVSESFQIINIGYDSVLTEFSKRDFIKTIGLTNEEQTNLFTDLITLVLARAGHISKDIGDFVLIRSENDLLETNENFKCSLEMALGIIPKYVFSHIPVGPFENKYYFVKR